MNIYIDYIHALEDINIHTGLVQLTITRDQYIILNAQNGSDLP